MSDPLPDHVERYLRNRIAPSGPGVGWTPKTDRDRYAYLDIPARWTDEFPVGTRKPGKPTHRGLAIKAERRTFRQTVRAFLPRVGFRR